MQFLFFIFVAGLVGLGFGLLLFFGVWRILEGQLVSGWIMAGIGALVELFLPLGILFGSSFFSALIVLNEIVLSKPAPADPVRERQFKEFVEQWKIANPDPKKWGNSFIDATKKFMPKPGISIKVRADWRDYAPLRDGLPEMHFRIQVTRPGIHLSEETRAQSCADAESAIRTAFGW